MKIHQLMNPLKCQSATLTPRLPMHSSHHKGLAAKHNPRKPAFLLMPVTLTLTCHLPCTPQRSEDKLVSTRHVSIDVVKGLIAVLLIASELILSIDIADSINNN